MKNNFFVKLKRSIFNLEKYEDFINEKMTSVINYFLILSLIVSVFSAVLSTYDVSKAVNKGISYIENEFPDFSYQDGVLDVNENVEAYDSEYDLYLYSNTSDDVTEEQISEYKKKILTYGVILLKDKALMVYGNTTEEKVYTELLEGTEVTTLNKSELIDLINDTSKVTIYITIGIVLLMGIFIAEIISILIDWMIVALFAWCVAKIVRVKMSFKQTFILSIYSLTLSIVLGVIYSISNYLFNFYIEYFRTIYLLIAYVYVIASIMMLKDSGIKQAIEIKKIEEEQEKVHQELCEENEKNNSDEKENSEEQNKDEKEGM